MCVDYVHKCDDPTQKTTTELLHLNSWAVTCMETISIIDESAAVVHAFLLVTLASYITSH